MKRIDKEGKPRDWREENFVLSPYAIWLLETGRKPPLPKIVCAGS